MASEEGPSRSGASASTISNSSPMTKRLALTLPSRYFAARSGRAGVRRGSSIAFAQQLEDRAGGLAFAALGPRRLCRWRPAVDIGDLRIEPGIVRRPQRHSPQRIVLLFGATCDVQRQCLIIGVKGR